MVNVLTSIQIACPRHKVASYVSDPDMAPEWYVNIKSARWLTPKPLKLGSQIVFIAHFLGRRLEYTYEVIEYYPLEKMVMQTVDGPFAMRTTYTWEEPDDGKTYMTLRNEGHPTGFSKLLAPFMVQAMKKANKKDLNRLKQILESDVITNEPSSR